MPAILARSSTSSIRKNCVKIRTYTQKFTNNPNEKLMLMILGSQAKLENDQKVINVKRGFRARARWAATRPCADWISERKESGTSAVRCVWIRSVQSWSGRCLRKWEHGWSGRQLYGWLERLASKRGVASRSFSVIFTLSSANPSTTASSNIRTEAVSGFRANMNQSFPRSSSKKVPAALHRRPLHPKDGEQRIRIYEIDYVRILRQRHHSR